VYPVGGLGGGARLGKRLQIPGTGLLRLPGRPMGYDLGGRAGGAGRCRKPSTDVEGALNKDSNRYGAWMASRLGSA